MRAIHRQRQRRGAPRIRSWDTVADFIRSLERRRVVAHRQRALATGTVSRRRSRNIRGVYLEMGLPCQPCLYRRYSVGSRIGCPSRQCLTMIKPSDVAGVAPALAPPGRAGTLAKRERQGDHKQDDNGGGDRDELYVSNDV